MTLGNRAREPGEAELEGGRGQANRKEDTRVDSAPDPRTTLSLMIDCIKYSWGGATADGRSSTPCTPRLEPHL
jgi:hypothetical protein